MPIKREDNDVLMIPGGPVRATAAPPGSKSLTNRFLICAALADGTTELSGASFSDDSRAMLGGLEALGIQTDRQTDAATMVIHGCRGHLPADAAEIDVGPAGTTMRFLAALACLGYGEYRLDGSTRMRQRPIGDLVDALRNLGARIEYGMTEDCPPLNVYASGLTGGEITLQRPPSSQFISALLMVAPYARQDVLIRIMGELPSQPYVEMTRDVMRAMGVETLAEGGNRFIVPAPQRYQGGAHTIEPDASGATYLWAAAALTGGQLRVPGLTRSSRQGDAQFVDVLAAMGCAVEEDDTGLAVAAPPDGALRGVDVDLNAMPDTVQTLAFVALFADGPTDIRNVANLRVKETDRLAALHAELTRLGAAVELRDDGLRITPPDKLTPATLDTYEDHRMAMSGALPGLVCPEIRIRDAGCVTKSFPNYFELLHALTGG